MSRKLLVPFQLPADPTNPLEAATKQYADLQRWNSAWGVFQVLSPLIAQNGQIATTTACWSGSVSLVAGRRYVVTSHIRAFHEGNLRLASGGGNTVPLIGTIDAYFPYTGIGYGSSHYSWLAQPSSTASYQLVIDAVPTQTTARLYAEDCWVEDVGPVTVVTSGQPVPEIPPVWTTPSPVNGWENYGAGFTPLQYRKVGDEVSVRGLIKNGTIGWGCTQLPVGMRPPGNLLFAADCNSSAHARAQVEADGWVVPFSGNNLYFSLSGINFSVTP